jgi:precorrin-2/cobalt-factor-2 C20-methyltransferase
VGVGPGDPEMLTLKAVRILGEADVIAAPRYKGAQTALDIVKPYIGGKDILLYDSPMHKGKSAAAQAYDNAAAEIAEVLRKNRSVALVTLGDPSVYSSYAYIRRRVQNLGYETETVAGVPSFCAAAAKANISLCDGKETLLVMNSFDEYLDLPVNKVLMKNPSAMSGLTEKLAGKDVTAVTRLGMDGEAISCGAESLKDVSEYFTLVIVKERSAHE